MIGPPPPVLTGSIAAGTLIATAGGAWIWHRAGFRGWALLRQCRMQITVSAAAVALFLESVHW